RRCRSWALRAARAAPGDRQPEKVSAVRDGAERAVTPPVRPELGECRAGPELAVVLDEDDLLLIRPLARPATHAAILITCRPTATASATSCVLISNSGYSSRAASSIWPLVALPVPVRVFFAVIW